MDTGIVPSVRGVRAARCSIIDAACTCWTTSAQTSGSTQRSASVKFARPILLTLQHPSAQLGGNRFDQDGMVLRSTRQSPLGVDQAPSQAQAQERSESW